MSVDLVVKLTDELVYAKTGKHLDELQRSILRGSWHGQHYAEIAEEVRRTEGYVREVGASVWRLLSDVTGETIEKKSFRAAMERITNIAGESTYSNVANSRIIVAINHSYNHLCAEAQEAPFKSTDSEDWRDRGSFDTMPDTEGFIGREDVLETLTRWTVEEECRLIGLWGLPMVGKSSLAAQFVDRVANQFSAVIWRTITSDTDPHTLAAEIAELLSRGSPPPIRPKPPQDRLFNRLQTERCLLILDGLEAAFLGGSWAGTWRAEMADFASLLDRAARGRHPSCILVTSREQPLDWVSWEEKYKRTRSRTLNGLNLEDALALLQEQNLTAPEAWSELVEVYRGHPGWLKAAARSTQTWFGGNAAEFVSFGGWLCEGILASLNGLYDRLTDSEKHTLSFLSQQSTPVAIASLRQVLNLSAMESLTIIESLRRRSLLEMSRLGSTTTINLAPGLRTWVKDGFLQR
ncbi:NB-ARC domain-containing protein [Oscillatoria sp. FACHB-1406]|uniref:NB-ARC domain-containing protein n=1 Tax=Oscillatoria sp. FACHB-1406 TaxID=2692846 RepID=UPI0016886E2A|nr:NB-ARC domain-containing protein [Oscillatoria sp. FACHB-1406]MBD2580081.1 hypothetical protein [Oscillatoria sp. FACHB-1406]